MAAETGRISSIIALLMCGADPGASDVRGRSAYACAKDKNTRDAFRKARAQLEEGVAAAANDTTGQVCE